MGQVFASDRDADDAAATAQPLLQPAMEGNLDEIKVLIGGHIASTPATDDAGDCSAPPPDVVDQIIRDFVNRSDPQGNRPLHGAVFGGHLDVVRFLVEGCGADVTARNGLGCSPTWLAAGYGHVDILRYLIGVLKKKNGDASVLVEALGGPNDAGDTPLLAAASRGHVDACRVLLEAAFAASALAGDGDGAGRSCSPVDMLRARNAGGDTCLTVAVGGSGGQPDRIAPLVDLLLEYEDPRPAASSSERRPIDERNARGLTPLLVACERGNADVARHLAVRHGADASISDKDGASPLAVAVFCGHRDVAGALLDLPDGRGRALLDVPNHAGCTPLWLAARTGNVAMVEWLTSDGVGADESIANSEGLTPKQAAEKYEKKAVVEWFRRRDEEADVI